MRILIVDDSALIRNIVKSLFEGENDIELAGEATNGEAAIEKVKELEPDIVLMDINMPILNGLDATKRLMEEHPVPICIFSNEVDSDLTVRALGLGALDAIRKPDIDKMNDPDFLKEFLSRLRSMSRAHLPRSRQQLQGGVRTEQRMFDAVVIGASTGGPAALKELLGRIPGDFPLGIALVQHIEDRFDHSFADWLNTQTALAVRLAREGDRFSPGSVLVAPGGRHLVCREGRLSFDDGPKIVNQRPAVDALFTSAARVFKKRLFSVLLTGMGTDGADGSVAIKAAGGITLVQDEATSTIFGMPKAAIDRGGASQVLPLNEIPGVMISLAEKRAT